jgi:hypothetical protein
MIRNFPGILSNHAIQFVLARDRESAKHAFKEFLYLHDIKYTVAKVKNPRPRGKLNGFLGEVEQRIRKLGYR